MPIDSGSVIQRRRLARELRRLRAETDLTLAQLVKQLGGTSTKWSRIEKGESSVHPDDLTGLLMLYDVDVESRRELMSYARGSRPGGKRSWWTKYSDVLNAGYTEFIAFENEAAIQHTYQPLLIPGLLQTEAYAHATHAGKFHAFNPDQADDLVEVRMRRRRRLEGDNPLVLNAFLSEASLRIHVGGRNVMQEQLAYLVERARLHNVSVRVVPNSGGIAGAYDSGVTLLDFPDAMDASVAFLASIVGTLLREEARDVKRLIRVFEDLSQAALSEGDSIALIEDAAGELNSD
ncbi:DUF5753 domain-containing protein [Embleya hyalina]|uniref:Transcriptional regulator n=1 Tax=Embleya hyalina TaxID=516124 RepID=A0A401YIG0_9ACTN|nr:DUF5753 domain-containing protein [Embleya hyalina]GCD94329.1 transcriptional regulator [Embleya hyalina]